MLATASTSTVLDLHLPVLHCPCTLELNVKFALHPKLYSKTIILHSAFDEPVSFSYINYFQILSWWHPKKDYNRCITVSNLTAHLKSKHMVPSFWKQKMQCFFWNGISSSLRELGCRRLLNSLADKLRDFFYSRLTSVNLKNVGPMDKEPNLGN